MSAESSSSTELMIPHQRELGESNVEVLARHSRSFRLASHFLPRDRRYDAALLYALCRLVDDTADECDDPVRARVQLKSLSEELREERFGRPLVEEFLELCERRCLDLSFAMELVQGVESDLEEVIVEDDQELLTYCYRVAGTVGLMMCSVLGVKDREALAFAIDLGIGMQLTNICRDVLEDARRGRVYLPRTRLEAVGVSPEELLREEVDEEALATVVKDLLEVADRYYGSGDLGMRFIPWRSRLAIVVASQVYRAIGVKLGARGARVMEGRTVVSGPGKIFWVIRALMIWVLVSPPFARGRPEHEPELHHPLKGLPGVLE